MRLKRSGFSLVLSLTMMAALVLMVIVLASFLQVESRLAQSHAGHQRAKLNALASARIAIGHLQQTVGADQRVTMRADMFAADVAGPSGDTAPAVATNPNKPPSVAHQKRYWTGVWSTGGADSTKPREWNVADPHESRLFLGWLTSPTLVDSANAELVDKSALNYYLPNRNNFDANGKVNGLLSSDGQKLINALGTSLTGESVRLVGGSSAVKGQPSSGSVQWPSTATTARLQEFYGAIDLPVMPMPGPSVSSGGNLGANGRFAYWIGDEGIKAKVNLPDVYATNGSGASLPGLTDWDKGFAGSAAQRSSYESVTPSLNATVAALMPTNFDTNYLSLRNLDVVDTMAKAGATWNDLGLPRARSRSDINSWANKVGGVVAGDALTSANRLLWHEITPWSYSVLSDTLNGGMKTDLSTAFELPYSVFRTLDVYPGQKETTVTTINDRKPSFFHGAPNATTVAGMASDLDYNRPNLMDKIGSATEILKASPRSPEWAPRYLSSIGSINSTISLVKTRNGAETPERLGFAYEVPLSSKFFNQTRIDANVQSGAAGAPSDVFTWPTITGAATHPDNWTARIIRGPTWDLYRNHYRMYKREIEAAAATSGALRDQGAPADSLGYIARGVEPLTYATGLRDHPVRRSEPITGDDHNAPTNPKPNDFFSSGGTTKNYHYRNNLADGGVGPDFLAQRRYREPFSTSYKYSLTSNSTGAGATKSNSFYPTYTAAGLGKPSGLADSAFATPPTASTRTWPTSPVLAPTILRFSTIYSGVRKGNDVGMIIDPIVVIHNPYDVALEFEGLAMVTNGASSPFKFLFRVTTTFRSTEYQYKQADNWVTGEYPSTWPLTPTGGLNPPDPTKTPPGDNLLTNQTIDIGDVVVGSGENDNRSMSFRIVAGSGGTTAGGGNVIRLEPGEIKIIGSSASTGSLINSGNTNVSIPGDIGFTMASRAFYKMTPFHNVRARSGSGTRSAERVLWTLDFDTCHQYAEYDPDGAGPQPAITRTFGGINDKEYARRLRDLWILVQRQRKVHDAMVSQSTGTPWDGTTSSLDSVIPNSIQVVPRNSGWVNYNGYVVGAEGEIVTTAKGFDNLWGTADDTITYSVTKPSEYVAPFKRNGKIAMDGNQSWNFYLIGKKSIDGGATLNTHRRWFGTPDEDASSYVNETVGSSRKIKKYAEGTQTVGGFNCVDESLLLNFQAMTAGWPMYSNSNHETAYYTVPDLLWTKRAGLKDPDYRIEGSTGLTTADGVTMKPFQKDPEFNDIEITGLKADTLFNAKNGNMLTGEDKYPVLMLDFVRRAADMTADPALESKWYPNSMASSGFGMNPTVSVGGSSGYGYNFVLKTPEEMRNAPMTPYFLSDRAQQAQLFGYDGKAHTPVGWVQAQRVLSGSDLLDAKLPTTADKKGAFWGASIDDANGGKSNIILYSIPRRPLLSLSQLGTVAFAEKSTDADITVGSSFAHPGIGDLTRIVEWPGPRDSFPSESSLAADVKGPVPELGYVGKHMASLVLRNRTDVRTDHAFAANFTLWDAFYFSGLNLQANSFSHLDGTSKDWPNAGADLPIDSSVAIAQKASMTAAGLSDPKSFAAYKLALNEGKSLLANKRMVYIPDGKASYTTNNAYQTTLKLPESEFPNPKYLARNSLYDGGFNVNSTSRAAWKAVLAGMKGQALPDATNKATGTALTKFARAFGTAPDKTGSDPWTSYRELDDNQIDALAGAVVDEVRTRGPFMSLADFINRRLINDDNFGLTGALQAAIDKATTGGKSLNEDAIAAAGGTFSAPASVSAQGEDPNTHLFGELRGTAFYTGGRKNWWKETSAYPKIPNNKRFPSLRAMGVKNDESKVVAGLGAPGIITQMDVLNSIGPNLTARSDTFVVRAYGEALDDAGNVIGKAWVEVVVQRTAEYVAMTVGQKYPDYVEPNRRKLAYRVNSSGGKEYDKQVLPEMYERSPAPAPPLSTALEKTALLQEQRLNRILGRRFRPSSLRWLTANEI